MIRVILFALLTLAALAPEAAAVYDPATGRWLTRDPLGTMHVAPPIGRSVNPRPHLRYVDGMNLYQGVRSNPVRLTDPLGAAAEDPHDPNGYVDKYLKFWICWLGMNEADAQGSMNSRKAVSKECQERLKCIIQAIRRVESVDGKGDGNFPARDPLQCGNPGDGHTKCITGETPLLRPVRRGRLPSLGPHYSDVPGSLSRPGFDNGECGVPDRYADPNYRYPGKGHQDPAFTEQDSYFWGILWYFMRTNQRDQLDGNRAAWNIRDCSWNHLIDGAEAYNGGGDADYRRKIEEALDSIECCGDRK